MASDTADEQKGIDPVMVMRIPTIISGCIIAIIGIMQVVSIFLISLVFLTSLVFIAL
jgi:hypothetical protein